MAYLKAKISNCSVATRTLTVPFPSSAVSFKSSNKFWMIVTAFCWYQWDKAFAISTANARYTKYRVSHCLLKRRALPPILLLHEFLQRRGLGPLLCYVMGLNESNHFSGLTSAFRAAYEQSNLKVGLISAFDRHTSLKVGLISAFDWHTSINRSISADHALAHVLEFGGE